MMAEVQPFQLSGALCRFPEHTFAGIQTGECTAVWVGVKTTVGLAVLNPQALGVQ